MSTAMPFPVRATWRDFLVALVSLGVEFLVYYGKLLADRLADKLASRQ